MPKNHILGTRWMIGRLARTPLFVDSGGQTAAVIVFEKAKRRVTPTIRDGKAIFDIRLFVKGTIGEMGQNIADAELIKKAEEQIRNEIRHAYLKGLEQKADVLNLFDSLYRKNAEEWKKTAVNQEFPLNADSLRNIEINVHITNDGRTVKPFLKRES